MPFAIVSRQLQFCAGPEHHTFYACEAHRAALDRGEVSCFLPLDREGTRALAYEDEYECDFCREPRDPEY